MTENEITGDILDASIKLHRQFGAGLLESVYETLLEIELKKRGHKVERQNTISFEYEGVMLENAFRLDMLVDDKVIVELKSTEKMSPVFAKQLKTYLVITKLQVGVVVNFGMPTLKDGFLRFVNNYLDSTLCASASLRLCARIILHNLPKGTETMKPFARINLSSAALRRGSGKCENVQISNIQ